MYEDYKKLRYALKEILTGDIDRQTAKKVLYETEVPDGPETFYSHAYLDLEPHNVQLYVVLSLMGQCPGTSTDIDKAEEILKLIHKAKEL